MMGKDILIVDTAEHPLHALVQVLGEAGYLPMVLWADDKPASHFSEKEYELVFVNLEADNAKAICDGIRSHPEGAITPIIFIGTGAQAIRSPADALSAGGDYYFAAPCDLPRVLAKVQTYLGPGSAAVAAAASPAAAATMSAPADALLAQIASREAEMARREQESAEARAQAERLAEQHRNEETRQAQARRELEEMRRAEEQRQAEARRLDELRRAESRRLEDLKLLEQRRATDRPSSAQPAYEAPAAEDAPVTAYVAETSADAQVGERRGPVVVAAPLPGELPNNAAGPSLLQPFEPEVGALSAQFDVAMLMSQAHHQKTTGRIDVVQGQRNRTLHFHHGVPVDASSSQSFDRIEEYLLREGKITRAQYQSTRIKRLRSARQVGAFLVGEGSLKPQELFESVRGHLQEQVFNLFEWEEGTFTYLPHACDEADQIALDTDPRALMMEGIRRKYLLARLVAKVGSPSSLVCLTELAPSALASLKLTGSELGIARLLDGQRNLEDVVFSSGVDALRVYQVVWGLVCTGGAEVVVRGIEGAAQDDSTSEQIDKMRIVDKAEQARLLDYFEILGITRSATPYEIEHACQHLLQQFDKGRFGPHVQQEFATQLQEIYEVLDDARDVLLDPVRRELYARNSQPV